MSTLKNAALEAPGDHLYHSATVRGDSLIIGDGFEARSFKDAKFAGLMDPLVMVDHFVMSQPTFGEHPHAGISAVSVLLEDSVGIFNSQDSLGNYDDLQPGDLYWLKAGKGATHDEKPVEGGIAHGLQIFVNLPGRFKNDEPQVFHVSSRDIPVIQTEDFRIRIVLGESNDVVGQQSPSLPLTILDAYLKPQGTYTHSIQGDQAVWTYAVCGRANLTIDGKMFELAEGEALAVHINTEQAELSLASEVGAHAVVLQGNPIREQMIQHGPFAMSNSADKDAVAVVQGKDNWDL
ncbi:MAG: pirin family protein [Gammaproteobacteria bacterium]|nr:pirin family protein [Pseudomonadales bacterium]